MHCVTEAVPSSLTTHCIAQAYTVECPGKQPILSYHSHEAMEVVKNNHINFGSSTKACHWYHGLFTSDSSAKKL